MSEQAPKYPEHEKLEKVQSQSLVLSDFLDWLYTENISLAQSHEHTENCRDEDGDLFCGCYDGQLLPVRKSMEEWLAQYFRIDLTAVEREKRQMLDYVRHLHLNDEEE